MAKILLVEDDNNLREIYEARLSAEGYDIVAARDGEEALTVAMKERPDLIISDVMMPKISGFDMLDIIRSTEETKDVKVIMMTALSQAEDKERAEKLGADRYLVKSQVTLEDVAKVAREVLNGESKSATPAPAPIQPAEPAATPLPTPAVAVDLPIPEPAATPIPAPEPVVVPAPTDASTPSADSAPAAAVAVDTPAPEPAVTPVVEPAVSVVPEPVEATPEVTDDVPAPEPVVVPAPTDASTPSADSADSAPMTDSTPDGQEQALPKVVASDSPALTSIAPAAQPETQAKLETVLTVENSSNVTQTVADEKAAIAAQIESFIESKKTSEAPPAVDIKVKKKVISPINDLNSSSGPDLNNLMKQEAEKDQMLNIAKEYANKKILDDEEYNAEAALKEAAEKLKEHPQQINSNPTAAEEAKTALEFKIAENGDLELPASPIFTENTTETPTIPIDTPVVISGTTDSQPDISLPLPVTENSSRSESNSSINSNLEPKTKVPTETADQPEESMPTTAPAEVETPQATPESIIEPETSPPPSEPVIPHKNGTSIDGVMPKPSDEPKSTDDIDLSDPNSIAL